jgi:membrane-bound serine protease (ClpP class)
MHRWIASLVCLLLLGLGVSAYAADSQPPVLVIQVKGEIDHGQAALVHRALADAKLKGAQAVLMEIDTFGGLVDAAVQIRDMVIEAPVPTICYIKNRAWSAGALIAISHNHIAIAPGGSIGAAEPIPTTEKTVAALKAEFASTANRTGRNPAVAEAMVDKSLGFPGYAEPGKILALTDYQAVKVGYAEEVFAEREQVLAHYQLAGAPVVEYVPGWTERFAGWLSNPTVKSLLVSVLFLAILTEIKTAGVGVAAMIGLAAAALFFGSQWLTGVAGLLEILLFIGGLVLIAIEFYTPGMTVFGLTGLACILGSIFLSLGADFTALNLLAGSLVVAVVLFLLILKRLPASKFWDRLVLKEAEKTEKGFISASDYSSFLEQEGVTLTSLRPAGSVAVSGQYLDVVSEGQYIDAGVKVKVIAVTGNRIIVRPIKQ